MDLATRNRKYRAIDAAEASGQVADSMDVRTDIVNKIHAGELTLAEGQALLKKVKRGAKAAGKVTRNQAFRAG